MEESLYVKWDYDQTMVSEVGNKAARLEQLRKIGIKVPEGFAITQKAFLDFMVDNRVYNKIKAQLTDIPSDIDAIQAKSQRLCEFFVEAEIPDRIRDKITRACHHLSSLFKRKIRFALRSSSIIEDLKQASFAGLYDTFLQLKSCDEVLKGVKGCWQSAFGLRALAYLKRLDLRIKDPAEIAMGVLVQKMINQRFAGVMFTVHPVSGDPSKILIEYSDSPRKLVVSGEAAPNSLLVDKITSQVDKEKGNLLDERYIYQLTGLARKIERHFGCYQDIEWVIDRDSEDIVILQARPETIWNERHQKPSHQQGQTVLSFIPEEKVKYRLPITNHQL